MLFLVLLLIAAGITKRAIFPFSSWLPAAIAAPTPVSALVHSSTLVTAGIFLIIRLCGHIELSVYGMSVCTLTGALTCLLGGWAATYENDLKKIIALSTLRQLGVIIFSIGLGYPNLALFHLFTHALFKALLFLRAGAVLINNYGTQDIRLLGGAAINSPLIVVIFNVTRLCLVGAPFLRAFYSKHAILEIMFFSNTSFLTIIIILVATFITAKYVFRVLKALSWSSPLMPIFNSPNSLKVDLPLLLLGLGALIAGKRFRNANLSIVETMIIPRNIRMIINLCTIGGLVIGLSSLSSTLVRKSLSTLFWLAPLFI